MGGYNILIIILSYLISFFSTYIVFDFMSRFDRNIHHKKYVYIISYIVFTIFLIANNSIFQSQILNILLSCIGIILIGHFLYNNKKIYLIYYSIFSVVIIIFQVIVSYIFNMLYVFGVIKFYDINSLLITNGIVMQIASLSASRLFLNWYKNKSITRLNKEQYFNFLILPIFSLFYIVTLMTYMGVAVSTHDTIFFVINIASIIGLNIFITNVFQDISKNNEIKQQLALYEQQAKMNYDYYNSLEDKYNKSRKVIHDIKNHIQTLEHLYKINEEDKVKLYSNNLNDIFKNLEQIYYSDNKVLNIIVNDKVRKAKEFNIEIDCKIGDIDIEKIDDIDLTTIFSNLLDNAIDEVKEFKNDKNITLKVDRFNDFIVINVANKLKSVPVINKDEFKTTKKDHQGLGLKNVRLAIEKYEGTLTVKFDEGYFKVNIVIPVN